MNLSSNNRRSLVQSSPGAGFAGHSEGLARALEKLGAYSGKIPMDANPATAHIFIVNPLTGKSLMGLFSTHPPLEERVARLRGTKTSGHPAGRARGNMQSDAKAFWDKLSR